jgi:uncharacterized membrane protein YuzA (DUF378 family)
MCTVMMVGKWLLVIGGINWGLVGLSMLMSSESSWNVVNMLLGSWPMVEGVVYLLVGVAAVLKLFGCRCSTCKSGVCATCAVGGETKM